MLSRAWQQIADALTAIASWRWFKPLVFLACLGPALVVAYELCQLFLWDHPEALGADPTKALLHETGQDALTLLFVTLAITPIRRLFKVNRLQSVRRMLGVWSFTYAVMHVCIYLVFDQLCYSAETCQIEDIGKDLVKRPFIVAGMVTFAILLTLAVTSTSGWVRRLKKNWQRLHRLVYVAAIAAVVHFVWIQKSDFREPLLWAYGLAILFAIRIYLSIQKRRAMKPAPVSS